MKLIPGLLLALLIALSAHAQSVLYITSGAGHYSSLYRVDPATAESTLIGSVLLNGSPVVVTALAFHPTTGVLYGVTGNEESPSRQFFIIDPETATATVIGTIGTARLENTSDLSFAPDGTLYGWTVRGGPLVTVGLADAARTVIGTAANGTAGNGLAFTPDGTLYLAGPTSGSLYTVDVTTGDITAVATLSNIPDGFGTVFTAMASDLDGVLYAIGRGSSGHLVTIDRVTGVVASVGLLSFGAADAMAFAPIPEPATWMLLIGGAGLLWLLRRRQVAP